MSPLPREARAAREALELWVALTAALVPFVHAGVAWFDSGHLTAAAAGLGVPHPTGYPLWVLAAHALSTLPVGTIPFRVALLSALSVAGAAALLYRLARVHGAAWWAALLGALVFPAVFVVWLHGTLAEVYGPNALVLAALTFELFRPHPRWAVAALVTGLGLGAHASFVVTAAALWPLALTADGAWRRLPRLVPWGLLGAAVVLYLPASAASDPWINWGDPSTAGRLWSHLTGASIRSSFAGEMGAGGAAAQHAAARWLDLAGGGAGALLVPLGLLSGLWVRPRRVWAAGAVIVGADAAFSVFVNPMGQASLQTGVPGAWGLGLLAAVGLGQLVGRGGRGGWGPLSTSALRLVAALVGGAVVVVAGLRQLSDRPPDEGADAFGRMALEEVSPGGTVFATSDHLASQSFYLLGVEAMRPDLMVLVRQHLADTRAAEARFRHAGRPVPAAYVALPPDDQRGRFAALVAADLPRRPVWMDLGDGRFDPGIGPTLAPGALLYRATGRIQRAPSVAPPPGAPWIRRLARTRTPRFRTLRVASDLDRQRGVWHLLRGELAQGALALEEAVALDGTNTRALLNLAAARRRQGRLDEAIGLLQRALALDPSYTKARRNLAAYEAAYEAARGRP